MKTITLTDEAHHRLKSWKTEPSESFSKVVLKAVPKRGTAADMEEGFKRLPALTPKQSEAVAESLTWANDWHNCPAGLVVGLPWIVKAEFLRGAAIAGHNPCAVREFLDRFPVAWPDDQTLEIYAVQFAKLRTINALPGPHDLWIAASALQNKVPLVTRNTAQFVRIDDLPLENY